MDRPTLTLFHSPRTRSTGIRVLLEELGAPYELHVLNRKASDQQAGQYRAVNPMGKVPAVRYGDAVVTEQVALTIFLADLFPAAGLAPAADDPLRGPYLRWIAFYGSCFEPAVVDRAMQREPGPHAMSPYGTYDEVMDALDGQLAPGPWLLGERFTAADVLWGMGLSWTMAFKVAPERPAFVALADRFKARPAYQRVTAWDADLAAQQEAKTG